MTVPARVSLVTLGVDDVELAAAFYERLGWQRSPSSVTGEVAFFRTAGPVLALWSRAEQAAASGVRGRAGDVSLALNLASPDEVREVFDAFVAAGATPLQAPAAAEWGGTTSYVTDLDGHLWELAHNPGWPLGPDGLPQLP